MTRLELSTCAGKAQHYATACVCSDAAASVIAGRGLAGAAPRELSSGRRSDYKMANALRRGTGMEHGAGGVGLGGAEFRMADGQLGQHRDTDSATTLGLSVVVPVFNEQDHLGPMAEALSRDLDQVIGQSHWQFVLVDNGSRDGTAQVIERILAAWPTSRVLKLDAPNYGTALKVGLQAAGAPFAYVINVDFWDPLFLRWSWANRHQYDLILGSKRADPTINKLPSYRKFLSAGLNLIFQVFFDFVGRDTHGQKLVRLAAFRDIIPKCVMQRGQFDTELTMRALRGGLWVAEVPVPIAEKRSPRNLMLAKIWRNFADLQRLRRVMRDVPSVRTRYHRWSREDMEEMHIVSWKKHGERDDADGVVGR